MVIVVVAVVFTIVEVVWRRRDPLSDMCSGHLVIRAQNDLIMGQIWLAAVVGLHCMPNVSDLVRLVSDSAFCDVWNHKLRNLWFGQRKLRNLQNSAFWSNRSASRGYFWIKNHTSHKKHPHHDASHGIIGHEINNSNNSNTQSTPKFCAESIFEVGGVWILTDTAV